MKGEGKGWDRKGGEVIEYTQPTGYLWEARAILISACNLKETSQGFRHHSYKLLYTFSQSCSHLNLGWLIIA